MKSNAPIILFAFNRYEHFFKTISSLAECLEAIDSELFIVIDGPKNASDNEIQKKIINLIPRFENKFLKIDIIKNNQNLGLAKNIISHINTKFEKYEKLIILEDDVIVSKYFLNFMNLALCKYQDDDQVMHVSGFMYPIDTVDTDSDCLFLNLSTCWGWGTWKRSWLKFEKNPKKLIQEFKHADKVKFNLNGSYDYWDQVLLNYYGKKNTWAIFWYAAIFMNKGLSVHPKVSLTQNIGFDGSGENCDINSNYVSEHFRDFHPKIFPTKLQVKHENMSNVENWYKVNVGIGVGDKIFNKFGLHKRMILQYFPFLQFLINLKNKLSN